MQLHITLRQLEIFCSICTAGNAVQAGKNLGLSQSAISSGLKTLEHQLNVKLFERVGKRLVINEQGKQFYAYALSILEQAGELEQLFNQDSGEVHIGASSTIGNYLLPPILAKLRQAYPLIHIRMTVANSNEIISKVANFECDIGLIEGACNSNNIITQIWQYDELLWFCAKNSQWITDESPINLNDLLTKPLIMREKGSGSRQFLENAISAYNLSLQNDTSCPYNVIEFGNSEAIKQAVRFDLGIGCLSSHVLKEFFQLKLIDKISTEQPTIKRPLLMIQHRFKSNQGLLKRIKEFL